MPAQQHITLTPELHHVEVKDPEMRFDHPAGEVHSGITVQEVAPNVSDVAIELQAIALQQKMYPIDKLFNTLCEKVKTEEEVATLFVEHARYRIWKETRGITEDKTLDTFNNFQGLEFDACLNILNNLSQYQDTLREILYRLPNKDYTHLFLPLRHLNGRL
jgi:hypothetical protein